MVLSKQIKSYIDEMMLIGKIIQIRLFILVNQNEKICFKIHLFLRIYHLKSKHFLITHFKCMNIARCQINNWLKFKFIINSI